MVGCSYRLHIYQLPNILRSRIVLPPAILTTFRAPRVRVGIGSLLLTGLAPPPAIHPKAQPGSFSFSTGGHSVSNRYLLLPSVTRCGCSPLVVAGVCRLCSSYYGRIHTGYFKSVYVRAHKGGCPYGRGCLSRIIRLLLHHDHGHHRRALGLGKKALNKALIYRCYPRYREEGRVVSTPSLPPHSQDLLSVRV